MNPLLYEVFARTWLATTGAKTLADIPDDELDRLEALGFDHLWLMGVWTLGDIGLAQAKKYFPGEDVLGSPYAVARYAVSPDLGGDAALAALRPRLAKRGIRLILDFIPNHTARDHHWITEAPEIYVHLADGSIACGKDPYFPPWSDTAQLDLRLAATHTKLIETLRSIETRCDGVRCDMTMLVLSDVFAKTWQDTPSRGAHAAGEFWAAALDAVLPDFTMIAEAYWDLEPRLQRLGFDYTYDKKLYDLLINSQAAALRAHLNTDLDYQMRSVRFLENHDEPRLAHELPLPRRTAALVLALTQPGMRLIHDGQLEGRKLRMPVQLAQRPAEAADPVSIALHDKLLAILRMPALRQGTFRALKAENSLLAHRWEHPRGSVVIVVNFSDTLAQCRIPLQLHGVAGRLVTLRDQMDGAAYERDGDELVDPTRGLFVMLEPWQSHVFVVN